MSNRISFPRASDRLLHAAARLRGPAAYYAEMVDLAGNAARDGDSQRAAYYIYCAQLTMRAFSLRIVPPASVRPFGLSQEMADPTAGISRGRT